MNEVLVEAKGIRKYYPLRRGFLDRFKTKAISQVKAVDDVTLSISSGETLGLVGESGSGKTTIARIMLKLESPTTGQVFFKGKEITKLTGEELRRTRNEMQIVFQNPYASLDPRQRVKDIISEPLSVSGKEREDGDEDAVLKALDAVGLPKHILTKFPHQFSGGQRQRIAIARALVLRPKFVILDEPTSALDSSVQAQILNLFREVQEKFNLTYLFITHNLNVVRYMSDRVAVMYSGKIVEIGGTRQVLENPLHPYTQNLLRSAPQPYPESGLQKLDLRDETLSSLDPSLGCKFHPRCPYAEIICRKSEPDLREIERGHWAACYFAESIRDQSRVQEGGQT